MVPKEQPLTPYQELWLSVARVAREAAGRTTDFDLRICFLMIAIDSLKTGGMWRNGDGNQN